MGGRGRIEEWGEGREGGGVVEEWMFIQYSV